MTNFIGHIRSFMGEVDEVTDKNIVDCMDRLWENTCLADDNYNFANIAASILTCLLNYESLMKLARNVGIRGCRRNPEEAITSWYINTNIV